MFGFLNTAGDFAATKGLSDQEQCLKYYPGEDKQIISIASKQLAELEQANGVFRLSLFNTINSL